MNKFRTLARRLLYVPYEALKKEESLYEKQKAARRKRSN